MPKTELVQTDWTTLKISTEGDAINVQPIFDLERFFERWEITGVERRADRVVVCDVKRKGE